MKKSLFKNKNVLILGGTGSVGSGILQVLTKLGCKRIIIFSRDEYKQHRLKYKYASVKNIQYVLGDIRDFDSLNSASKNVDIIFHCAALKQVPFSEENPEEFIKTNILGSINVKKVSILNNVSLVLSISTDKAVNPSNVMGLTKAMQEKLFSSNSLQDEKGKTRFVNIRFGNVIGTSGSFFPIIYHQIKNKMPITITNPQMTRFFMPKREALELILWASEHGKNGSTIIRSMKSVSVEDIVQCFFKVSQIKKNYPIKVIGTRVGEKQHEVLISEDEALRIKQQGDYYIISPYGRKQIEQNIIDNREDFNASRMVKFISSREENKLNINELESYVREYIKEETDLIQYI